MVNLQEVKDLIRNCNPILLGSFMIKDNKLLVFKNSNILVETINISNKFPLCYYDESDHTIKFKK